ncbi:hypothetical protein BH23GEM2_BH23GEM2_16030 [soil metagenome]
MERTFGEHVLTTSGYFVRRELDNPIPPRIIQLSRRAGGARVSIGTARPDAPRLEWDAGVKAAVQRDGRLNYANMSGAADELTLEKSLQTCASLPGFRRRTRQARSSSSARRNPRGFMGYGENTWGIMAIDGPGPATKRVSGRGRRFFDYAGRGVPYGPDDGTLALWAVASSLPFAPEIVLPALATLDREYPMITSEQGCKSSYNPTFGGCESGGSWISKGQYALEQGPVIAMIENFRSRLVWRLLRNSGFIRTGLSRAGFRGGWLRDSACQLPSRP